MNNINWFLNNVINSVKRGRIDNRAWKNLFLIIDCEIIKTVINYNINHLKGLINLKHNAHNLYNLINE